MAQPMSKAGRDAERLAYAVYADDTGAAADILAGMRVNDLRALAVELAGRVPVGAMHALTVTRVLERAARRYGTTAEEVLAGSRRYEDATTRAVACYVLHRLLELPSAYVGRQLGRDHSSVLHACARVGEDGRLKRVAHDIAGEVGWERDVA